MKIHVGQSCEPLLASEDSPLSRRKPLWCSFCGKNKDYVKWLVEGGPKTRRVFICNECFEIVHEIARDKTKEWEKEAKDKPNGNGEKT